jgi:hypothetical protein
MASFLRVAVAAAAVTGLGCAAYPLLVGGAAVLADRAERQPREPAAQDPDVLGPTEEDLRSIAAAEKKDREAAEATEREERERRVAEEQRMRDERERLRIEQAELLAREQAEADEHAALVEKRKRDPQYVRPILSALICYQRAARTVALDEMRTEKRYSELGGVQNNVKLYALQQRVREMDEGIAESKRLLASKRWKALPCVERRVKMVVACLEANEAGEDCDEQQRPYAEVMGFE